MKKTNFFKQMELATSYMINTKNEEAYSFLVNVDKFIDKATVVTSKRRKQYLGLRFLTDSEAAMVMGISESSVRRLKMETSDKLYELFSDKFFDILYSGNLDECKLIFSVVSGEITTEDICNSYLGAMLSPYTLTKREYAIGECLDELKFLAKHSKFTIMKEFEDLDESKLGYLLSLTKNGGDLKKMVELAKLWKTLLS